MKHSPNILVIFLLASCGPSTTNPNYPDDARPYQQDQPDGSSQQQYIYNDYPTIVDTPLTEYESANSVNIKITNNPVEENSPSLLNYEEQQAEMAPELDNRVMCDHLNNCLPPQYENCRPAIAYINGIPRTICVVTIHGKLVEINTARAFQRMAAVARDAGVNLIINRGFQTMNQQRFLYSLYPTNTGSINVYPGFATHQSGVALDIGTNTRGWLNQNAHLYGFHQTVEATDWHWEWNGMPYFVGPTATPQPFQCHSATLNRLTPPSSCVQARSNRLWYSCTNNGIWTPGMLQCTPTTTFGFSGGPEQPQTTCYSTSLHRDVPIGTCVRNQSNSQIYVCARTRELTTNLDYITAWFSPQPGTCAPIN